MILTVRRLSTIGSLCENLADRNDQDSSAIYATDYAKLIRVEFAWTNALIKLGGRC